MSYESLYLAGRNAGLAAGDALLDTKPVGLPSGKRARKVWLLGYYWSAGTPRCASWRFVRALQIRCMTPIGQYFVPFTVR